LKAAFGEEEVLENGLLVDVLKDGHIERLLINPPIVDCAEQHPY
jgi:hypothetical protein